MRRSLAHCVEHEHIMKCPRPQKQMRSPSSRTVSALFLIFTVTVGFLAYTAHFVEVIPTWLHVVRLAVTVIAALIVFRILASHRKPIT
jgi:membrane protein YdbS with pleckstrin-like domain